MAKRQQYKKKWKKKANSPQTNDVDMQFLWEW